MTFNVPDDAQVYGKRYSKMKWRLRNNSVGNRLDFIYPSMILRES